MTLLGAITGPEDLRSVPLFGLAIAPPSACPNGGNGGGAVAQPIPVAAPSGYALLAGLLALVAAVGLRRRAR